MRRAAADARAPFEVDAALRRAQHVLWQTQRPDGSWDSPGELGPFTTAQAGLVLNHLGRLSPEVAQELGRWLRSQQRRDGSFVLHPAATRGDLGTTACVWAALSRLDPSRSEEAIAAADGYLQRQGGVDKVIELMELGDFSALFLALAGLLDPARLPCPITAPLLVPPVMSFLETRFHSGVFMTSFALEVTIRSLRGDWESGSVGLVDRLTRERCLELLLEWQNHDGSWIDSVVLTSLLLPALPAAGLASDHPAVLKAVDWMFTQLRRDGRGSRFDAFGMEIWVTGFELRALMAGGVSPADPDLQRGLEWLVNSQLNRTLQPRANNRKPGAIRVGGWALESTNHTMPDCDDTGVVLSALGMALQVKGEGALAEPVRHQVQRACDLGRDWLLNMQNPDGGWSAYVWGLPGKKPGPTLETTPRVKLDSLVEMGRMLFDAPISVGDPSTEDVTARVLHGLGQLGMTVRHPNIAQAVEFLRVQQCVNGAFWSRWGVNYLNATAFVLLGLAAVGADLQASWVRRAVRWVLGKQNPDGGWGEDPQSYRHIEDAGKGPSAPPLTGLVVLALMEAGEAQSPAVERGIAYLLQHQRPDGSWPNRQYLHTNIPPDTFYLLPAAANYYPAEALGAYRRQPHHRPSAPKVKWNDERLEPMRQQMDPLADGVVDALVARGAVGEVNQVLATMFRSDEPVPAGLPPEAVDYFQSTQALPPWADPVRLAQGQELFTRAGWQIAAALFCSSLPQAYAAANGAHVLTQTQGMTRHVRRRIFETAQFLFDVFDDQGLGAGGRGVRGAQKVRLMHAAIRQLLLSRPTPRWDSQRLGLPINQEDLAGTLMTFSVVPLDALERLGVEVSSSEAEGWVHCWKVVGHLMGVREDLLPEGVEDGRALMDAIRGRQWAPSQDGRILIAPLIELMQGYFPGRVVDGLPVAMVRHLAGDHCADLLGLPASDWTVLLVEAADELNVLFEVLDGPGREATLVERASHFIMKQVVFAEREGRQATFRIPTSLRRSLQPEP